MADLGRLRGFGLCRTGQMAYNRPQIFADSAEDRGTVAQLVEHEPFKLVVAGSSPARLTILKPRK